MLYSPCVSFPNPPSYLILILQVLQQFIRIQQFVIGLINHSPQCVRNG